MRGIVAKRLRKEAVNQVTVKAALENREHTKLEFDRLVKHKKVTHLLHEYAPKLKQSARQTRKPNVDPAAPAARYCDRPMKKSGTTMRIKVNKPYAPPVPKMSFKMIKNKPQNKVIVEWFMGIPRIEKFSGIKTESAARRIISKRTFGNIKTATWWNEERKPLDLLVLAKDLSTN